MWNMADYTCRFNFTSENTKCGFDVNETKQNAGRVWNPPRKRWLQNNVTGSRYKTKKSLGKKMKFPLSCPRFFGSPSGFVIPDSSF
jgi:hypothetical protein